MEINYLNEVDSTHKYLKDFIKINKYTKPIAIVTTNQTNGIGSRDNRWIGKEGNLFFSFVINKDTLPIDLPMQSASIYFSFLLKELLSKYHSKIWLKWPNDFYLDDKKIGGTITNLSNNLYYCGIGINLIPTDNKFGYLDIRFNHDSYLEEYFTLLESGISWKQIFSKYLIEFKKSKHMKTTINQQKVSLKNAVLNFDGSISIHNEKVYSLR